MEKMNGAAKAVDPETRDIIQALLHERTPPGIIANQVGVCIPTVKNQGMAYQAAGEGDYEKLRKLYKQGQSGAVRWACEQFCIPIEKIIEDTMSQTNAGPEKKEGIEMGKKLYDNTRDSIMLAVFRNQQKASIAKKYGVSENTVNVINRSYQAAQNGDIDELANIAKQKGNDATIRWACNHHDIRFDQVKARLEEMAKPASPPLTAVPTPQQDREQQEASLADVEAAVIVARRQLVEKFDETISFMSQHVGAKLLDLSNALILIGSQKREVDVMNSAQMEQSLNNQKELINLLKGLRDDIATLKNDMNCNADVSHQDNDAQAKLLDKIQSKTRVVYSNKAI